MRGQPEVVKFALLTFTGGILLTATVEEIIPEAHSTEDSRLASIFFIAGSTLFAALSVLFAR